MKRILKRVLPVIFALSVMVGLLGRQLATRDTADYQSLQPEFTGVDTIETVMHDREAGLIYVCYSDANFVNVYTESGEFCWAVGTPYIRGNCFCLQEGMLLIYGDGNVYCYDGRTGAFLKNADEDEMELPYDSDATDQFTWDSFRVWDGAGKLLVDRPGWYVIFDFFVTWCIAAVCGLGYGLLEFLDRGREAQAAAKKGKLTDRRARMYCTASMTMVVLHLGYGVAMLFHGFFNPLLMLGIFPITIHFILSGWIWQYRPDRWDLPVEEYAIVRFWRTANIASLIAMVALYVVAVVSG